MPMRKTNTTFLIFLILFGCADAKILVSIPDLKGIAEKISGEEVETIIPSSVDPHYFSISYFDLKKLEEAEIVLLANSELIEFELKIKEICGEKCLDFKDYNATILQFPGLGYNFHAYWLFPENALKIGLALKNKLSEIFPERAEEYERNYENFRNSIELARLEAQEIVSKFRNYNFIALDPHSAYAISALSLNVVFVFPEEVFPSANELESLKKLQNCVIVVTEYQENTKIGEMANQIAEEIGCGVARVKVISELSFESQLIANAVLLSNPTFKASSKDEIIISLSLIALAEAIALVFLWQSKRRI